VRSTELPISLGDRIVQRTVGTSLKVTTSTVTSIISKWMRFGLTNCHPGLVSSSNNQFASALQVVKTPHYINKSL
uniref:Transposase Tc1-like domain-containing protein n=1 Tax=Astyanax mexicanus TaxID=7994 RepID=A0A8B9L3N6_ASTMX